MQEGQGANKDRHGADTQSERFRKLVKGFGGGQPEGLVCAQLGNEIMVIRVKPLRHFQRPGISIGTAAGHGEIGAQVRRIAGGVESWRDCIDQQAGVEHLIVKAEIVGRNKIDTDGLLQPPVFGTEAAGGGEEIGGGRLAGPGGFQCAFEFAVGADAGKAQIVGTDGRWGGRHIRLLVGFSYYLHVHNK